jgi:hypothetical protein
MSVLALLLTAGPLSAQHDGHGMPRADTIPVVHPMETGVAGHSMMAGPLGIPRSREGSGTAWLPDASPMYALHSQAGPWSLMLHGNAFLQYIDEGGERGESQLGSVNWLMGMARRPLGGGELALRAMLSAEPLTVGECGFPQLLQSGESCDGEPIHDRQHPHDLFMELAAKYDHALTDRIGLELYGGPVAEPALGPVAFPHRPSSMSTPSAPVSHHWLDASHISFGVLTGGIVLDRVKLEVSRFNGREPDQHRWDIETGPLDSTAVRLSWNPTRTLSLQGSWGHFTDAEQLEPGVDQKRWSASALWADEIAPGWKGAATLAWGRKTIEHHKDDAYVAEASLKHGGWTLFGRGEITENRELVQDPEDHGPAFTVGKISLGAVRDFRIAEHLSLGAGGLFSVNFVPDALESLYGGSHPTGAMGFVRLKLD